MTTGLVGAVTVSANSEPWTPRLADSWLNVIAVGAGSSMGAIGSSPPQDQTIATTDTKSRQDSTFLINEYY